MYTPVEHPIHGYSDQEFRFTLWAAAVGVVGSGVLFLWCVLTGRPWPCLLK